MEDRFERLTNLVTFLLDQRNGASFAQILEEIPGWPEGEDARRRAFERDKRVLRDEGIPLIEEKGLYRIPPERFYLPDLELTEDEQVALRLAVAAVPGSSELGANALNKLTLGTGAGGDEPVPVVAALDEQPILPILHAAIRDRATLRFRYAGGDEVREVEPALLFFREGNWYVVGHDRLRDARRSFRVDRIDGDVEVGPAGSFEPAATTAEEAMPRQAWLYGDAAEPEQATVEVDAVLAAKAIADIGGRGTVERRADGSAVITMPVTNREAFRTWVLGMLDHAVVLGSPELRADVIAWLESIR
ncbi:MAG TPA: WYL domain-containing protein [Acidimicrobiales bacterium]|nr:WYL domain-containing protein [Acidimicrobiales bacterium]HVM11756.1 WYL domain-containing protein [Actinomycetota bacterium]